MLYNHWGSFFLMSINGGLTQVYASWCTEMTDVTVEWQVLLCATGMDIRILCQHLHPVRYGVWLS